MKWLLSNNKQCAFQKIPKCKKNKLSSKIIINELVILPSEVTSTESHNITTTPHDKSIYEVTAFFEEHIEKMGVNNKTKAEKSKPETIIENRLDEIRYNYMKNIYSLDMKI